MTNSAFTGDTIVLSLQDDKRFYKSMNDDDDLSCFELNGSELYHWLLVVITMNESDEWFTHPRLFA